MGRSSRERTAKAARACPAVRGGRRCAPGGTPARSTGQRRGERLRACVARGRGRGGRDRSYRSPASARPAAAYTTSPGDTCNDLITSERLLDYIVIVYLFNNPWHG